MRDPVVWTCPSLLHVCSRILYDCMKTICIYLIMFTILLTKTNALRSLRGRSVFSTLLTPSILHRQEQHFVNFMSKQKGRSIVGTKDIKENIFNNETMEERIENAEKWVTYQLSDTASNKLNKALGIESDILDAVKQGERLQNKVKKSTIDKIKGLEFSKEAVRMKGFMQQNPSICPGCGTPFQSRTPDHPGYLSKDMLHDHQHRVALHKSMMEAIKVLDMAGLELDDPRSEEVLRGGYVPEEIIYNIQKLAKKNRLEKERIDIAKADKVALENGTYLQTAATGAGGKQAKTNPKVQFNPVTNEYEPVYRHPQEGVPIDLIQPMSIEEIEAYNNRYSRYNRNKVAKHTTTSSSTTSTATTTAERDLEESDFTITLEDIQPAASLPTSTANTVSNTSATTSCSNTTTTTAAAAVLEETADNNFIDLIDNNKVCICQRCYRLQHYGQVEEALRPGWSNNELLTPERFEKLLSNIKHTPSVVLCLVDIFDLRGSILRNLKNIVGTNPLVIAANKIDLLPADASMLRLTNWIHSEIKAICGYTSGRLDQGDMKTSDLVDPARLLALEEREEELWGEKMKLSAKERKARREERESNMLRRADVHLVSCQTGLGMDKLLADLLQKANTHGQKIHVMGAANVGKSSFINRLIESAQTKKNKKNSKNKNKINKSTPQATVSNLPGTTLDFLRIALPNGVTMIDTPGLLQKGQLTSKLNSEELRQVLPAKEIKPLTLRLTEGKCVLLGALARVELLKGRPCFLSFFVSNEVKLHQTDSNRADDFIEKHVGELIAPPANYERYQEIGPYVTKDIEISGESWKKSEYDIVIAGLGWVSLTGPGNFTVRVTAPVDTIIDLRPALLPYEAPLTTVKFTGGRMLRKGAVRRTVKSGTKGALFAGVSEKHAFSSKQKTNKKKKWGNNRESTYSDRKNAYSNRDSTYSDRKSTDSNRDSTYSKQSPSRMRRETGRGNSAYRSDVPAPSGDLSGHYRR